jgi:hypothetical protein
MTSTVAPRKGRYVRCLQEGEENECQVAAFVPRSVMTVSRMPSFEEANPGVRRSTPLHTFSNAQLATLSSQH